MYSKRICALYPDNQGACLTEVTISLKRHDCEESSHENHASE